jgi:hypothetical protein
MVQLVLALVLLIISCSNAQAKCIVNTDCTFEYVPVAIADGYSWVTGLDLVSPNNNITLDYKFDDDTGWTSVGTESDTCPPTAGACMNELGTTGTYRIIVDASLIPAAEVNKRLCLKVVNNATQTVPHQVICNDVGEGGTVWATYEIVDMDNESGNQNPTSTQADTNLTWTVNFTNTTPQPIMYFPTVAEDARQDSGCTLQGLRSEITAYDTGTNVITYQALPAPPEYTCIFRIY